MYKNDSVFFSGIRSIIQRMHSISVKQLAFRGLSRYEMTVLLRVYEENGKRQRDILNESGNEGVGIGLAIKTLSERGYISREQDSEDRRQKRIFITKRGLGIRDDLIELKSSIENFILDGINKEEIESIEHMFLKIKNTNTIEEYEEYKNGREVGSNLNV